MKLKHMEEWVKFLGRKKCTCILNSAVFSATNAIKVMWNGSWWLKLQLVLRDSVPDFLGRQLLVVAMAASLQEDPCGGWRAWFGWNGLDNVPWFLSKVGWANFPCLRMVALYYSLSLPHVWCSIWRWQNQTTFGFLWGHLSFMAFFFFITSEPINSSVLSCLPFSPGKNQMRSWHESGILVYPGRFGTGFHPGGLQGRRCVSPSTENSNNRRLELMPLTFPMKRATMWLVGGTLEGG